MNHLGRSDFERLRSGAASAEEAEALGRHVAECPDCAAVAAEALDLPGAVDAFEAAFSEEPRPPRRQRSALWLAAAAAVAAMLFLFPRSDDAPVRPVSRPPAPATASATAPPLPATRLRPAEWDALVAEARRTRVLPFPADIRRLAAADSFRGEPVADARGELWPAATAIDDERPELRWPASPGARYTVMLTSEGRQIARSGPLATARWRVPSALRRGTMYRWQVTVEQGQESRIVPAPPAPPAIFRLITEGEHQELARARSEAGGDPLLLALLHARVGMVEEARRALDAYERSSGDPLARHLRGQLPYSY